MAHYLKLATLAIALKFPVVQAADYYVATSGNDSASGSISDPFATIQRAANSTAAGDTVYIRAGTYRETVTPTASGTAGARITYRNYASEAVTVSGADVISSGSWTSDTGNIHKTPLAANAFVSSFNQATQIFVDGEMVTLARWPNTTTKTNAYPSGLAPAVGISHPAKSTITTFVSKTTDSPAVNLNTGIVTDTSLPLKSAGFYDGAEIFFQPNNAGWSWTFSGTVTTVPANGTQITFTTRNDNGQDGSGNVYQVGSRYYLFNKKELLDAAGEWWHDKTNGQLYLWTPTSVDPATRLVEFKKRDYAFNLTGRSYITIQGLTIFASTITTDSGSGGSALGYDGGGNTIYPWRGAGYLAPSTGVILDGITARYFNHFTDVSGHFFMQWGTASGIVLSGTGHTLRNSTLEKSAGNGVLVQGENHVVFNNTLNDLSYGGVDTSAINTVTAINSSYPTGRSTDHEIAYNTIRRTGRSGITPRTFANSDPAARFKARIHHNDIAHFGLQDWDVGGLYTATGDGKFARIDHNLVSEGLGYTASGIYLDYEKNWVVDHNVVWNVEWGLKFQGSNGGVNNTLVYNNTSSVRNTSGAVFGPFAIGNGSGNNNGTVLRNNILSCYTPPAANGYQAIGSGSGAFSGAEISNNLAWDGVANSATDPKFVSRATTLAATGVDYMIQTGSAAINAGAAIPSYTRDGITVPPFPDHAQGAPDAGAYEFGVTPWIAGASLTRCTEPIPSPWPGFFGAAVTVTLRTLTPGATIRYTTDGTTPTATTGTVYTGPFQLSTSTAVRSISTLAGMTDSPVALHYYDVYIPPALGAPLAFAATATAGPVVTLVWTDNASQETGYLVERSPGITGTWTQIATLAANSTAATDSSASPNTEYSYRVRPFNGGGTGSSSNEVPLITPGVFTQPGTLTASQTTNTQVTVPVQIRNVASSAQTFTLPAVSGSYVGITSAQPGGPDFGVWTDISDTGTVISSLSNRDDAISPAINIGFSFPFYGTNRTQLKVCSNGFLTFDTTYTGTAFNNTTLPSTFAPRSMVAFFWDDLFFSTANSSRAYSRSYDSTGGSSPDTFVIQFSNVVLYSDQSGPTATFQVVLKKDGSIRCNYLNVQPIATYTIGINNGDGTSGVQLAYDTSLVTPNFALQFSSGFGLTASPSSLFVAAGATATFQLTVNSTGLAQGNASANFLVTSNLARQPAIVLPVNLTVLAANPAVPAPPAGLTATPFATAATLTWTDVATETSYKLERSPNGSTDWTQIAWLGQHATTYTDAGLASGSHHYRLRATSTGGDSAYSSIALAQVGLTGLQVFRTTYSLAADGSHDLLTPAGDGVANLLKYAFNLIGSGTGQASSLSSPNTTTLAPSGSAGLPLVGVESGTGKLQLSYVRHKASATPAPGISYAVEFSDALAIWAVNVSATESAVSLDDTFERVTMTDTSVSPAKRFARVRVTRL